MHGRRREEQSAEDEAKKQKERQGKVAAYQHAMKKIFQKRQKNELDHDMLSITGQVLTVNPDIHTLWNIRKQTLLLIKSADLVSFMDTIVPKELDFTEFCLKANPKSYGAWHHRYWLMKETGFKRVAEELKLCSKYLQYDDRNFHGWDYRRFLLDNCELVTLEQELKFTTEKISTNFSNFSSWHLRSKLLPQLSRDYLDDELELIRNAVFTDPKDQSAWLYHLWLLKSQLVSISPKLSYLHLLKNRLIICFNVSISAPTENLLKIDQCDAIWTNPWSTSRSKIWFLDQGNDNVTITGELVTQLFSEEWVTLKSGCEHIYFDEYFDEETKPKSENLEKLFREELSWVLELHDLEPEIKWPILTAITLMRMINFKEFKTQILEMLDKLESIDASRTNYYKDLRSKYIVEWILADKTSWQDDTIDLHGLHLTAIYFPERLCNKKIINCSQNNLKNGAFLAAFLSCEKLNLENNHIENSSTWLKYIQTLKNLKDLNTNGNTGFEK